MFVALQLMGLLLLTYVDATASRREWSALPQRVYRSIETGRRIWTWDFLDHYEWGRRRNWIMLGCLLMPFMLAKSVDWILNASIHSEAPSVDAEPPEDSSQKKQDTNEQHPVPTDGLTQILPPPLPKVEDGFLCDTCQTIWATDYCPQCGRSIHLPAR